MNGKREFGQPGGEDREGHLRTLRNFDADLFSLEQGVRDMARKEDLSKRGCERLQQWAAKRRLAIRIVTTAGPTPEQRGLGGEGTAYSAFVGRSEAQLDAALRWTAVEEQPGHPERDRARMETGRLLGYPDCCVAAFVAQPRNTDDACLERLLGTLDGAPLHPLSNWLVPNAPVRHVPCSWDCPASAEVAARVLERAMATDATLHDALRWILSRPLLVYDRFRVAVIDGSPAPDGTLIARRCYTFLDLCTDEAAHGSAALQQFARQVESLPQPIAATGLPEAHLLLFHW